MKPGEVFSQISEPTLLLNQAIARQNLRRMAEKARAAGVRFRPHFKTHQSARIGEWFREEGVTAITVSSVEMALYFSAHGWEDILVAFPANLRQMSAFNTLARQVRLGLLVESLQTVEALAEGLQYPVDLWLKIDSGSRRTGLAWDQPAALLPILQKIRTHAGFRFQGLLTHSGHTYGGGGAERVIAAFETGIQRLDGLRQQLAAAGYTSLEISVGDTPGCSLSSNFQPADEIRPGNFIFYDGMQAAQGVCNWQDVAVCVACPVVALHPERGTIILYGGAIHLSKEFIEVDGLRSYGLLGLPSGAGWSPPLPGASLISLSQEHGVAQMLPQQLAQMQVGDLVCVYPIHSCLAVSALGKYLTLEGEPISTFGRAGW